MTDMNQLKLLIELAKNVVAFTEDHAGNPRYDLGLQAQALGIDPIAAEWLVSNLAGIETRKPWVHVATVEHPGASDSNSALVSFNSSTLAMSLDEEQRIFNSGPGDDEGDIEDDKDVFDDCIVTDYGTVHIR